MTMNPESPKDESKKESETKKKITETIDSLKKNEKIESLIDYVQTHTQETIAYALMIIGIVWMLFQAFYGGLLVGLVAGFYFSKDLIGFIKGFNLFIEDQGVPRTLILGGVALAFFLMVPGFFIGTAIMVGLKMMLKVD